MQKYRFLSILQRIALFFILIDQFLQQFQLAQLQFRIIGQVGHHAVDHQRQVFVLAVRFAAGVGSVPENIPRPVNSQYRSMLGKRWIIFDNLSDPRAPVMLEIFPRFNPHSRSNSRMDSPKCTLSILIRPFKSIVVTQIIDNIVFLCQKNWVFLRITTTKVSNIADYEKKN